MIMNYTQSYLCSWTTLLNSKALIRFITYQAQITIFQQSENIIVVHKNGEKKETFIEKTVTCYTRDKIHMT